MSLGSSVSLFLPYGPGVWIKRVASTVLPALFAATAIQAQSGAVRASYRARILGVMDSSGTPVENVWVTGVASGLSALTSRTGTVSLAFLPDGGDTVWIRKVGYRAQTLFVAISPNDTAPVMVLVGRIPTELPGVTAVAARPNYVSPALRAFEERRSIGFGQFIDESELRKSDGRALPDLLRRLTGVLISCSSGVPRRCTARSLSTATQRCPFVTYLNGIQVRDLNLYDLTVDQLAGVEAYSRPSQVPPQYNASGSACGVLLFWFRER